jgi:hypothetical protein
VNLEGSLEAFGLPDVFGLLAMSAKSGGLRLRNASNPTPVQGVVWFRDGKVTGASADHPRLGLVRRVVGSGAVEDAALTAAVSRALNSPVGVARALLEAGAVEQDLLREAAVDQAVDAVFDLSRWLTGDFEFDPGVRNPDDVGLSLDHAWLISEAKARGAHWDEIRAAIPGSDSVLLVPVVLNEDPVVSRDEWALLALVDGRRSVDDLIELTGCGQFAVASVLAGLVRRGLLSVRTTDASDHVDVVMRRLSLLAPIEFAAATPEPVASVAVPVLSPEALALSGAQALSAALAAQGIPVQGARDTGIPARTLSPAAPPYLLSPAAVQPRREVEVPAARREVVPPRPEPFLPERRPEHVEVRGAADTSFTGDRATRSGLSPNTGTAAAFASIMNSTRPQEAQPVTAAPLTTQSMAPQSMAYQPMSSHYMGATAGNTAMAAAALNPEPTTQSLTGEYGIIERDPAMNRSLLLRLIAGVRGL